MIPAIPPICTYGDRLRNGAALAVCLAVLGCSSTGTLTGDIKFTGVAAGGPVEAYLAQQTVSADPGNSLRLYLPGSAADVARGPYELAGSNLGVAGEWRAATYRVDPVVDDAPGTAFAVEVDSLQFASGARYRFGVPAAGQPHAHASPAVAPLGTTPFHLAERPCLVKARFVLTGDAADIDALGANASNALTCVATAYFQLGPAWHVQASAARGGLAADTLRNSGDVVDLLFRDQPGIQRGGVCVSTPPQDSGFALNDDGSATFVAMPLPASGSCDTALEQTFEVPVQRGIGALTGLFDVNAETETYAQINVIRNNTQSRFTFAPLVPAGQIPAADQRWRIDDLRPGEYSVSAVAVLRDGDVVSTLPARTGQVNLPVGVAAAPPDTDLGSTFVTRATAANGKLLLLDPSSQTELRNLTSRPLIAGGDWWRGPWSFLRVTGDWRRPPVENGGGGEWAHSRGRLRGALGASTSACSDTTDLCELDYTVLLTGLSAPDAARDGSESRVTRYDYELVNLSFGTETTNYQQFRANLTLAEDRLLAQPQAVPVALEPLRACVGQIDYRIRVREGYGTLYLPTLTGGGTISSPNTRFAPSIFGDITLSRAQGLPKTADGAGLEARVSATLPEGARYNIQPGVTFKPDAGGPPTEITGLPRRAIPAGQGSVLGCGQIAGVCEHLNSPSGSDSTLLAIGLGDLPQCRPDGSIATTVRVASGGENVQSLTYRINEGAEVSLCGSAPCGADPQRPLPAPGEPPLTLADGTTLTVRAVSANGCEASYTYTLSTSCPVPAGARRFQLAFFDETPAGESRLKVHDASTGASVADVAMGAGRLRYSRDGGKLAVVSAAAVQVLDADNLGAAALGTFAGAHADAAFSPADERLIALLKGPAPNGSYVLSIVSVGPGPALLIGPQIVAPANVVAVSRPYLAWSPDGTRIAVAYDARTASGERVLRTTEWRITDGQFEVEPVRDGEFGLAAGESLLGLSFAYTGTTERYVVASSQKVYTIQLSGFLQGAMLPTSLPGPIGMADVHRGDVFALSAGGPAPVLLAFEAAVSIPPTPGDLSGLALSDYLPAATARHPPLLAVARRGPAVASGAPIPGSVLIYTLDASPSELLPVGLAAIPALKPLQPVFRPPAR